MHAAHVNLYLRLIHTEYVYDRYAQLYYQKYCRSETAIFLVRLCDS